ncbi:MAG: hypothetical protein ACRCZF_17545, partial [Gemmataceae bacterium]
HATKWGQWEQICPQGACEAPVLTLVPPQGGTVTAPESAAPAAIDPAVDPDQQTDRPKVKLKSKTDTAPAPMIPTPMAPSPLPKPAPLPKSTELAPPKLVPEAAPLPKPPTIPLKEPNTGRSSQLPMPTLTVPVSGTAIPEVQLQLPQLGAPPTISVPVAPLAMPILTPPGK